MTESKSSQHSSYTDQNHLGSKMTGLQNAGERCTLAECRSDASIGVCWLDCSSTCEPTVINNTPRLLPLSFDCINKSWERYTNTTSSDGTRTRLPATREHEARRHVALRALAEIGTRRWDTNKDTLDFQQRSKIPVLRFPVLSDSRVPAQRVAASAPQWPAPGSIPGRRGRHRWRTVGGDRIAREVSHTSREQGGTAREYDARRSTRV